jgi:hypothetical protein
MMSDYSVRRYIAIFFTHTLYAVVLCIVCHECELVDYFCQEEPLILCGKVTMWLLCLNTVWVLMFIAVPPLWSTSMILALRESWPWNWPFLDAVEVGPCCAAGFGPETSRFWMRLKSSWRLVVLLAARLTAGLMLPNCAECGWSQARGQGGGAISWRAGIAAKLWLTLACCTTRIYTLTLALTSAAVAISRRV